MSARLLAGTLLVCASLTAVTSAAQPAPPPTAQTDAWMEEGIRLRAERRDAEALAVFRRAWEAARSPEARAQMALAEQALGLWIDAERDLLAALAAADHPWIARNRGALDASLAEIRGHLGTLEVRASVAGARVRVNASEPLPLPLPSPLRLVIGTARVEVMAEGYVTARRELEVRPGDDLLETFELVRQTRAVAAPPVVIVRPPLETEPPAHPARVWGTRLLVGGGGLLVVGVASLVWREVAAAEFNDRREPPCDATRAAPRYGGPLCESLYRQTSTAEALALTGFVAGGIAMAGGLALLLAAPRAQRRAVACAPGALSVACAVSS